jgi:hypothetical protein
VAPSPTTAHSTTASTHLLACLLPLQGQLVLGLALSSGLRLLPQLALQGSRLLHRLLAPAHLSRRLLGLKLGTLGGQDVGVHLEGVCGGQQVQVMSAVCGRGHESCSEAGEAVCDA